MSSGAGESGSSSGGGGSRLSVRVESWEAVAGWRWEAKEEDICGMCRSRFEACCGDCRFPGDECPVVWGACSHCFHMHCILKWHNSHSTCPLCRADWSFKQ